MRTTLHRSCRVAAAAVMLVGVALRGAAAIEPRDLLPRPIDDGRFPGRRLSLAQRLRRGPPRASSILFSMEADRLLRNPGNATAAAEQITASSGRVRLDHPLGARRAQLFLELDTSQRVIGAPISEGAAQIRLSGRPTGARAGLVGEVAPDLALGMEIDASGDGGRYRPGWAIGVEAEAAPAFGLGAGYRDAPAAGRVGLGVGDDRLDLGGAERWRTASLWLRLGRDPARRGVEALFERSTTPRSDADPLRESYHSDGSEERWSVIAACPFGSRTLQAGLSAITAAGDVDLFTEGSQFGYARYDVTQRSGWLLVRQRADRWELAARGGWMRLGAALPGARLKSWPFDSASALSWLGGRSGFAVGDAEASGPTLGARAQRRGGRLDGVALGLEIASLSGHAALRAQSRDQADLFSALSPDIAEWRIDRIAARLATLSVGWQHQFRRTALAIEMSQIVPIGYEARGSTRNPDGSTESIGARDASGDSAGGDGDAAARALGAGSNWNGLRARVTTTLLF